MRPMARCELLARALTTTRSPRLRRVHGLVRPPQQRARRLSAWSGSTATPKLASTDTGKPCDIARLCKRGPHPLGHLHGAVHRAEVGEHQGKLVATDAGQQVAGAPDLVHPGRYVAQHLVANVVAQAVVDPLETVEVDQHDRYPRSFTSRRGHGVLEVLVEQAPVWQLREHVVGRLMPAHQGDLSRAVDGPGSDQQKGYQQHAPLGHDDENRRQGKQDADQSPGSPRRSFAASARPGALGPGR